MARGSKISIQFTFETDEGDERTIDVHATVAAFVPAVLNPVDRSHPDEGGEIEDIELVLNGVELSFEDAVAMGLNSDKLDQAIYDAVDDQNDDYDDSDDYFDDDDY